MELGGDVRFDRVLCFRWACFSLQNQRLVRNVQAKLSLGRIKKNVEGWSVEKTNEKAQGLSIGTLNLAC